MQKIEKMFDNYSYTPEELQIRIDRILNKAKSNLNPQRAYRNILGSIDLTTLEGSDRKSVV